MPKGNRWWRPPDVSRDTSRQFGVMRQTTLAILVTIQFAGLLQPVSTLEGSARVIGTIWPTTYYMHSSLGAYTKGLSGALMLTDIIVLACAIPILLGISTIGLKKQDK